MAYDGAERCCYNEVLYVYTGDNTGPALVKMEKDSAGEWGGALAAQLVEMAAHTLMRIEWVEQEDCQNRLAMGFGYKDLDYHCVRLDNTTVPLARFLTHSRRTHWLVPPEQRTFYQLADRDRTCRPAAR